MLSGQSAVYGRVSGDVRLTGSALVISGEEIQNDTPDTLVISGRGRSVIRDDSRDELAPQTGGLDASRQVRAEFVTMGHADHYEALRVTLLDNDLGVVDKLTLRLKDVWGKKAIPNNPYLKSGVTPHIWVNDDKTDWYAYHPTPADYQVIRQATSDYLSAFRERVPEHDTRSGPKLVYICTPLRGEAEQNITLAKETARVVFQGGDIPICPNLLFTLIATPGDPVQEQAAQEMGLRLVELCQQVNVYGPVLTPKMQAETQRAHDLGIPVIFDQKRLEKTRPRPKRGRAR